MIKSKLKSDITSNTIFYDLFTTLPKYSEPDVLKLKYSEFTNDWIGKYALDKPILLLYDDSIENNINNHIYLPKFNEINDCLQFISNSVGNDTKITLINVFNQSEVNGWTLSEYIKYYMNNFNNNVNSNYKKYNLISLEVSLTSLTKYIYPPKTIRCIDWIDQVWPINRRAQCDYPRVQKYCLISMADSYTDFHIDFGGTSVWYHVVYGRKIFYMIPPTNNNLLIYEDWLCSSKQNQTFFGNLVNKDELFQIEILPGQTMVIPSGWIHAVYTPENSVVFGGNFLHYYSILKQLQVFIIEQRTNVSNTFRFPYFKQISWYSLTSLLPIAIKELTNNKYSISIENSEYKHLKYYLYHILNNHEIIKQFCVLLKCFDNWLNSSDNESEKTIFQTSITELNMTSPNQVLNKWWDILLFYTESNKYNSLTEYINNIKKVILFNLFHDDLLENIVDPYNKTSGTDDAITPTVVTRDSKFINQIKLVESKLNTRKRKSNILYDNITDLVKGKLGSDDDDYDDYGDDDIDDDRDIGNIKDDEDDEYDEEEDIDINDMEISNKTKHSNKSTTKKSTKSSSNKANKNINTTNNSIKTSQAGRKPRASLSNRQKILKMLK